MNHRTTLRRILSAQTLVALCLLTGPVDRAFAQDVKEESGLSVDVRTTRELGGVIDVDSFVLGEVGRIVLTDDLVIRARTTIEIRGDIDPGRRGEGRARLGGFSITLIAGASVEVSVALRAGDGLAGQGRGQPGGRGGAIIIDRKSVV